MVIHKLSMPLQCSENINPAEQVAASGVAAHGDFFQGSWPLHRSCPCWPGPVNRTNLTLPDLDLVVKESRE